MKFRVVVADPPWSFSDRLTMAPTRRGAASNYTTMTLSDLLALGHLIELLLEDAAILALWVPSALLTDGLSVASAWGFRTPSQIVTWGKVGPSGKIACNMGHLFRGATEHALICRRGKGLVPAARNRRTLHLSPALPHSRKPETIQDDLDAMFPAGNRLELFARRERPGWVCTGNQCPGRWGGDVRDVLPRLEREG